MGDVGTDARVQTGPQTLGTPPVQRKQPQAPPVAPQSESKHAEPHDEVHLSTAAAGSHGEDHGVGHTFSESAHGAKYAGKAAHALEEVAQLRAAGSGALGRAVVAT
ncbi:MAG: hypothetical protein FJX76_15535, partial [Armatimonadetes bacterium]|nr:hypothetical protein [Armatimonadota bacterium]